jgi:hypothetical protein
LVQHHITYGWPVILLAIYFAAPHPGKSTHTRVMLILRQIKVEIQTEGTKEQNRVSEGQRAVVEERRFSRILPGGVWGRAHSGHENQ